jgi:hypothetical protein
MKDERFHEIVNGPLHHPVPLLYISRLALALRHVVDKTGDAGERALEEYARYRQERDDANE